LTNGVTATTQSASDNSTKVATTAYTDTAISNLVNSAPSTLDTLKELSDALGSDPNFATTVTNSIATKLPLAGGTLTGNLTISNTVPHIDLNDTDNENDYRIRNSNGTFQLLDLDQAGGTVFFQRETNADVTVTGNFNVTNGVDVTGNITVTGTVDGRDLATDGTKLDGIESNATADQTASEIVALVADQTIAPSIIDMEDNEEIRLGTSDDLIISHDGSNSKIADGGTGDLILFSNKLQVVNSAGSESMIIANQNAAVELYYDNSKKLETVSGGAKITGTATATGSLIVGSGNDLQFTRSSGNTEIQNYNGTLLFGNASSNLNNVFIRGRADENSIICIPDGSVELYYDNSKKLETRSNGINVTGRIFCDGALANNRGLIFNDNIKISLGSSNDLEILHDGTNSNIHNQTNSLYIRSADTRITNGGVTEHMAKFFENGAVELFYDNSKKLETTSSGIKVTGDTSTGTIIQGAFSLRDTSSSSDRIKWHPNSPYALRWATNFKATFGTSDELQIYHDGSNSFIKNSTGTLNIQGDTLRLTDSGLAHVYVKGVSGGATELYYDNSKKLQTNANGVHFSAAHTFMDDNYRARFGNSDDLQIYHDGSNSHVTSGTGQFFLSSSNSNIWLRGTETGLLNTDGSEYMIRATSNGSVKLFHDNSKKFETTSGGISITGDITGTGHLDLGDDARLKMGASDDLEIFHSGGNSFIANSTGYLLVNSEAGDNVIRSSNDVYLQPAGGEFGVKAIANGSTELYYDNSKKLYTTSTGAYIENRLDIGGANNGWSYPKPLNVQGSSGSILALRNWDTTTYAADTNTSIDFSLRTGNTGNQSGSCEIRAFKENGTNGNNARGLSFYTGANGGQPQKRLNITSDGNVQIPADNKYLQLGASQDLNLYHDGSHSYITNATGALHIHGKSGENSIIAVPDGAVELYYDNSKKLETNSTGIHIFGNTGHADGAADLYGSGNDLSIFHDGSNSKIVDSGTGSLIIQTSNFNLDNAGGTENILTATENGAVELYYDNSKKLETDTNGVAVTGRLSTTTNISSGSYLFATTKVYSDEFVSATQSNSHSVSIKARNAVGNEVNLIVGTIGGSVDLYHNSSKKLETTSGGVQFSGTEVKGPDNCKFVAGTSGDADFFHDGSNTFLRNQTGDLCIRSNNNILFQPYSADELFAKFIDDGAVELYYDNSKKFETTSTGANVTGALSTTSLSATGGITGTGGNFILGDNDKIKLGASQDIQIYHDGTHSYIENATGGLYIKVGNGEFLSRNGTEVLAKFIENGAVELYYDNSKKAETDSFGFEVIGELRVGSTTHSHTHFNYQDGGNNYITQGNSSQTFFRNASGTVRTQIQTDGHWRWKDGIKAEFGDSDDLQIYHNGSNSFIQDQGTGNLYIDFGTSINLRKYEGGGVAMETVLKGTVDGAVELYHDNSKKLETSSVGVSITDGELRIGDASNGNDALIRLGATGTNTDTHGVMFYDKSDNSMSFVVAGESHGSAGFMIKNGGDVRAASVKPHANNTYDLGSSSLRWANIFTSDLSMSNEGSSNDVDGTWGSYTIQEGAEDLFLINKRSGKKYKFNLTEVS